MKDGRVNSDLGAPAALYKQIVDNLEEGVYIVDLARRITYWNGGAERLTGYTAEEVVGRSCSDNLLIHVNDSGECLCLTGCPLSATMTSGQPNDSRIYLHHKNGHRVPVRIRAMPVRDTTGRIVGGVETFVDVSRQLAVEQHLEDLRQLAMLDDLCGLPNRRYVEIIARSRFEEYKRYQWPLGVIFSDIDRFKAVNDTYGHAAGDLVLRMVAKTLISASRTSDVVGRIGGEEFLAVVAKVDTEQLLRIAERCRHLVQQSKVQIDGVDIGVTISSGVTLATATDTVETLISRADSLMYSAKNAGRNRMSTDIQ